ncbi:hypothetical protein KJ570_02690 [Patescibacteria group bacterium]|nr:hypothetical protein [Patescibacteria group bacterium]MBU2036526.1 hypothetical protein [Patescibacteria group bacterium]
MNFAQILSQRLNFNIGSFSISPSYIQAGAIFFLLFILVLSLANLRRHFFKWSVKGSIFGIFMGFILALILEGFLIIGGKTVLTEIVGWKNAPKPLVNLLDAGRNKLVEVLGISAPIPESFATKEKTSLDILDEFRKLNVTEANKVKSVICKP